MNILIPAVFFVVISSYFSNPITSAEASRRHSSHVSKAHKSHHNSNSSHHSTASWYGPGFHGKKTASGERFDMYAMTAAHRTLPLSSYAEITNLKNHRSVIVRINDRGPYHGRRALDLSYAAAKQIGIRGTGAVQIKPLGRDQTVALLTQ